MEKLRQVAFPLRVRIWAGMCGSAAALLLHQGAVFGLKVFLPWNEAGTGLPLLCQLVLSLSLYFPVIPCRP